MWRLILIHLALAVVLSLISYLPRYVVDMEAQLEETSTTAAGTSDSVQPTSMVIKMRPHPYQRCSQVHVFPKKKFGVAKHEYRSFKASLFDNCNWSNWVHWEDAKERGYCIIYRKVYALGQLTFSRNRENMSTTTGSNN